ncbi:hypothetical protein JKA74_09820 [Marivirga sp. S37H4]|uniref:Uncharacterized protein n=1 Tax=Marivirga aurantiaca TaxID=2802615 RepID=A0A934WYW2_9BACT|nr:hypothetical protein [Marivirga aurantiaca]MBK6265336.1 hypothetical protein [Marivirga aurantiaca]
MNITDVVQLFSLPLEIVGLTITILEIFYHDTSSKLEERLSSYFHILETLPVKKHNKLTIAYILGMFVFVILSTQFFFEFTNTYLLTVIEFLAVFFVGLNLALHFYEFYNRILPNRKLLALGLILTSVGIIGEIFQVFNIFY